MKRVFNFCSGPATLPVPVLEEASRGVLEIQKLGMSVLEISHRSETYEKIQQEAADRLLRLMGLGENTAESEYQVLFLGGGATLQFAMVPMNYLAGTGRTADVLHTGEWSGRAILDAKPFGAIHLAGSSEKDQFSVLPEQIQFSKDPCYIHLTTNNTIEGTQWHSLPDTGPAPLIADASSDLLGNVRDFKRFSLIYAGAQKNLGPAGVTVVVIKKSFAAQASNSAPVLLRYSTHVKSASLYNTPPVFAVYVLGLTLKWLEEQGGVAAIEKVNRRKAQRVYDALDAFPGVYEPTVRKKEHRSIMNLTFRLRDSNREKDFLAGARALGLEGLPGHRLVGGFRASMYNAFPEEGAQALADYLEKFAQR